MNVRQNAFQLLCFIAIFAKAFSAGEYDYNKGGQEWYQTYEACGSTRQSPIAIWQNDIAVDPMPNIDLHNYQDLLSNLKLENNGHTIKIEIPNSTLSISGGGLPDKYNLVQIHFHWGSTDDVGSEHTIGDTHYPAELHLVHIRDGMTLEQALNDSHGLAVLGVFYSHNDVSNNTALMPIIQETERVASTKSFVSMKEPLALRNLLPLDTSNFYTYNGSLTTPPCNEVVVWIIFTETFPITTSQLMSFRSIKVHDVDANIKDENDIGRRMLFNHRLPQPLHNRKVLIRKQLTLKLPTRSTGYRLHSSHLFLYSCIVAGFLHSKL